MKPDPQLFTLAATQLGQEPEHTLFFDDRLPNVQGARQAGLYAAQFTGANDCQEALQHIHLLY